MNDGAERGTTERPSDQPAASGVLEAVLADLVTEGDRLEQLVTGLTEEQWRLPTPAEGWDVATQIAHLAWTDEAALAAARDKAAWDRLVLEALESAEDPAGFVDAAALRGGRVEPAELLARWSDARRTLAEALRNHPGAHPAGEKIPWFGPPMSPTSMATARFMETWAHSLDVHDALGTDAEISDRIRHVAHLGVRTRNFAFAVHKLEPPAEEFRVELTAPSGGAWTWGPADPGFSGQRVTGPAYDFCLLVTQRRHRDDTDLVAEGDDAERWLTIAQAFAGPSGGGRESSR